VFDQVQLLRLISEGTVLQRESAVKKSQVLANEAITLHFIDSMYTTTANVNGE
jgi:hypothetical protein